MTYSSKGMEIVLLLTHSGYSVFLPGEWDTPSFIFYYGSGFIFAAIYIVSKLWNTLVRRQTVVFAKQARELDFVSDLPEIEEMTAASEMQRASHPRGVGQKVSDFFF